MLIILFHVQFILESMEESESERMHELLGSLKDTFLAVRIYIYLFLIDDI